MSGDWKPGTVARATVRGVGDLLVMRTSGTRGGDDIWLSALHVGGWRSHTHADVTDVRPLVVLDLDGIVDPAGALRLIANEDVVNAKRSLLLGLADQIEAQTKPPRIPEPGVWGVVTANTIGANGKAQDHYLWVRTHGGWEAIASTQRVRSWDDLIDPVLVRKGVES
jgi:hypothetical protein